MAREAERNGTRATFVPLVGPMAGSWISGNKSGASVLRARRGGLAGWELSVRALTRRSGATLDDETRTLLASKCVCFDRVEGSSGGFSMYVRDPEQRARSARWRAALLEHLHPLGWAPAPRADELRPMIYIARVTGTRVVSNEAALAAALSATVRTGAAGASAAGRRPQQPQPGARRVVMEQMPLAEQMRACSEASGLIGVHGQALALLTLLPWTAGNVALVEIRPRPSGNAWSWTAIYPDWTAALGIAYSYSIANLQPGPRCKPEASREEGGTPLKCNVTVHVPSVLDAVGRALAHIDGRPPPPIRVSHDPPGWDAAKKNHTAARRRRALAKKLARAALSAAKPPPPPPPR